MTSETIETIETIETSKWFCYLLVSQDNKRTYVGATIDPDRRLRQHNGEISGGASATRGNQWSRICCVEGFPNEGAALQFEWKWKNATKSMKQRHPVERRKAALEYILALDKPTRKAVPYSEYADPLQIHWEP